jgi:hypothetical protein
MIVLSAVLKARLRIPAACHAAGLDGDPGAIARLTIRREPRIAALRTVQVLPSCWRQFER